MGDCCSSPLFPLVHLSISPTTTTATYRAIKKFFPFFFLFFPNLRNWGSFSKKSRCRNKAHTKGWREEEEGATKAPFSPVVCGKGGNFFSCLPKKISGSKIVLSTVEGWYRNSVSQGQFHGIFSFPGWTAEKRTKFNPEGCQPPCLPPYLDHCLK